MAGFLRHHFARAAPVAAGQPAPARRALPVAIAASLAAHGFMAGVLTSHLLAAPSPLPSSSTPSAARARDVMLVSLTSRATLAASPAPLPKTSRPQAPRKPGAVAKASAKPAPPETLAPLLPAAAVPPPPPTSATQFAGLFAPIIRSPLGRGGWGRTSQASRPAPPLDAQQQREQAALAFQMNVQGRLAALAEASRGTERAMSCKIVIDTEHHVGEVACAEPADQAAPWSYLQGVLMAGTVTDSAQRLCFALAERQLFTQACPDSVPIP